MDGRVAPPTRAGQVYRTSVQKTSYCSIPLVSSETKAGNEQKGAPAQLEASDVTLAQLLQEPLRIVMWPDFKTTQPLQHPRADPPLKALRIALRVSFNSHS